MNAKEKIIQLMKENKYGSALDYYQEHRGEIPFWERGLLFRMIEDGLTEKNHISGAVAVMLIVVEMNFILGPYVMDQFLDMFSKFAKAHPYFHYYKHLVMPVFNTLVLFFTLGNVAIVTEYAKRVLGQKRNLKNILFYLSSFLFLGAFIVKDMIPVVKDYSYVKQGTYEESIYMPQQRNEAIYNDRVQSHYDVETMIYYDEIMDRKKGIEEFHPDYQKKCWAEEVKGKNKLLTETYYKIWVTDETYLKMSRWHYNSLDKSVKDDDFKRENNLELHVQYLPATKEVISVFEVE